MRRWIAVSLTAVVTSLIMASTVVHHQANAGGGGCHNPVTDASGTSVQLQQNCMVPTILRTNPGATITFTNNDEQLHSVTGASTSWGDYDSLAMAQTVSMTFAEDGIYPYFCVLHPGMIGAIVVGDPAGSGAVGLNADEKLGISSPAELVSSAPNVTTGVERASKSNSNVVQVSLASAAIALVLGCAVTAFVLRRKQPA